MIACLRTVRIPHDQLQGFLEWIAANGTLRREHGVLADLVLERASRQNPVAPTSDSDHDPDEYVMITVWPDHDTFDAWIDTPDRDRLTASPTHEAVELRPLTRFDIVGGYLAAALTTGDAR